MPDETGDATPGRRPNPVTSTLIGRLLLWRFPTHEDNRRFPVRRIPPSTRPWALAVGRSADITADRSSVLAALLFEAGATGFEELLEMNATTGFLVVRAGRIEYECYLRGRTPDRAVAGFSLAKVVTSALVGAAVHNGLIGSVHDPVARFLPAVRRGAFAGVTIEHLLNMTAGFRLRKGSAPWSTSALAYHTVERRRSALRACRPAVAPGTRWAYNDFGPICLAMVLEHVSGSSFSRYGWDTLFDPLGMEAAGWWLLDSTSADALENAAGGLYATPRMFAKLGYVYLEDGSVRGRRILADAWVRESTTLRSSDPPVIRNLGGWSGRTGAMAYKYGWWLPWADQTGPDRRDFVAIGHYGQYIYVSPSSRTVVVRTGARWGPLGRHAWLELLRAVAHLGG